MKNKKMILAAVAVVLLLAVLVGVYFATRPSVEEGSKTFTVVVVHADKTEKSWTITSSQKYVAHALIDEGILTEEGLETGMYLTVDGETSSWETNQSYWGFFIGEDYATEGMNTTAIQNGAVYKLVYTIG